MIAPANPAAAALLSISACRVAIGSSAAKPGAAMAASVKISAGKFLT